MAPGAEPETPPTHRRRVVTEPEEASGRRGCLWAGAILGIIVGVLFAFFAMGPLLTHFFGEANIEPGAIYDGVDIDIEPLDGGYRGDEAFFTFRVTLDPGREEPFPAEAGLWILELSDGSEIGAREVSGDDIAPGEQGDIEVRVPASPDAAGKPELLRLAEPRVRFEVHHFFDDE